MRGRERERKKKRESVICVWLFKLVLRGDVRRVVHIVLPLAGSPLHNLQRGGQYEYECHERYESFRRVRREGRGQMYVKWVGSDRRLGGMRASLKGSGRGRRIIATRERYSRYLGESGMDGEVGMVRLWLSRAWKGRDGVMISLRRFIVRSSSLLPSVYLGSN